MATHKGLVILAERHLWSIGCRAVLTETGRPGEEHPDAIGWFIDGASVVLEAKRTRKDFLAEWSRVDRKEHRRQSGGMGHKRYYIAPSGMIRVAELANNGWGLIEVWTGYVVIRRESAAFEPNADAEMRLLIASFTRVKRAENAKQQQLPFERR